MLDKVMLRLGALGVKVSNEPSSTDVYLLNFAVNKTRDSIKNKTNLSSIPQGLEHIAIDMAVGEFLFAKKSMGLLNVDSLDFSIVAKQIQDGDTNVVFATNENTTPEARFNAFINYLQHNEVDFVKYRVLTW